MTVTEDTVQWKAATWAQSVPDIPELILSMNEEIALGWPMDNLGIHGEMILAEGLPIHALWTALCHAETLKWHVSSPAKENLIVDKVSVEHVQNIYNISVYNENEMEVSFADRGDLRWLSLLDRLWDRRIHVGFPSEYVIMFIGNRDSQRVQLSHFSVLLRTEHLLDYVFIERPRAMLKAVA